MSLGSFEYVINKICLQIKYILIYMSKEYRLELLKLCYHPGWRLMRLGYRTCFHTLYDEKNIYMSKEELVLNNL